MIQLVKPAQMLVISELENSFWANLEANDMLVCVKCHKH